MKLEFNHHIFEKCANTKFNEYPSSRSRDIPCGKKDGQDRHTEQSILRKRIKHISQLVSLEFFIDINSFRTHYGPGVDSASNRNEYQEHFLGG